MTGEFLENKVDKLKSVFLNIIYLNPEERIINPSMTILNDLRDAINGVFDDNKCTEVLYTYNTDKPFFGIRINPSISPADAVTILSSEDKIKLVKYKVEFDSKLFSIGLSDDEVTALTIHEIAAMMDNYAIFDECRALIDFNLVSMDDVINIRDSVNYAQLIIFAIKDTLCKLSSILYKEDEDLILGVPTIQAAGLTDSILSAKNKIAHALNGVGESMRSPRTIILQWMFTMYKNMATNSMVIIDTLKEAELYTASRLDIEEIKKTIQSIDRIDMGILIEDVTLSKFFEKKNISAVNELSLFRNLKKSGLRTIEDDLYEFSMKVKNCKDADEAYMILRGINSRLGILEDYLYNEPKLSDKERAHWQRVADQYRELRIILSKKKFKEKSWGIFIDYDALDKLDKKDEEE